MSSLIKILPDHVVNKIAAGEVVERPASVVKELIENSIDAGATDIAVVLEQAGRRLIRITDNGCGMSREDAQAAFLRHATSKITSDTDLDAIRTMGFRGEALSSIASVSQVRLLTAMKGMPSGALVEIEAGQVKNVIDAAAPQGASLEISHLFYNTPARRKFLKSPATELSHIVTAVSRQAMAHAAVRFRLTHNNKQLLDLPSSLSVRDRLFQLYGGEIAENVIEFSGGRDGVHVHGLIGRPGYTRADRTYQDFYVNRRAVKNASLSHALYGAYGDLLMRDRHPVGFIFIEIDPALVDVNVHPAKAEVRFRNQSQIHDLVRDVIREGLRGAGTVSSVTMPDGVREAVTDYLNSTDSPLTHRFPYGGEGGFERTEARGEVVSPVPRFSDSPFPDLYPLAQVHDSFIVAQSNEGMALIDQHAAHERVLFEKLQDQFTAGKIPVQNMLIPVQVELGPADKELLSEYLPALNSLGFIIENFGGNAFMIKAVPALMTGGDYKGLLLDIIDELKILGTSVKMDAFRDEVLSVMACHPAIKVHRRLTFPEMERLITDLFSCRMPHSCPHGRPTVVRFSMEEIKKMFKRI